MLGGRSSGSAEFAVTLGTVYTYDQSTGLYAEAGGAPSATSFGGNSCNNALKEVSYNV